MSRLIASLQPLVPPAVDEVVRRCLAKDPAERWQTDQVVRELQRVSESTSRARPHAETREMAGREPGDRGVTALVGWLYTGGSDERRDATCELDSIHRGVANRESIRDPEHGLLRGWDDEKTLADLARIADCA